MNSVFLSKPNLYPIISSENDFREPFISYIDYASNKIIVTKNLAP